MVAPPRADVRQLSSEMCFLPTCDGGGYYVALLQKAMTESHPVSQWKREVILTVNVTKVYCRISVGFVITVLYSQQT